MELHEGYATLTELEAVANDLAWLEPEPFFFGASVLPLYLASELLDDARPTEDVDTILFVPTKGSAQIAAMALEQRLVDHGWTHDMRARRRNIHALISPCGVPVDVVMDRLYEDAAASDTPVAEIRDWPVRAARAAARRTLPSGRSIQLPTPAFFLACKIAASRTPSRWEGAYNSRDVEDIALLLTGCVELLDSAQAGPTELRAFLRAWATEVRTGSTPYGITAMELLEGNRPRSVPRQALHAVLLQLAEQQP